MRKGGYAGNGKESQWWRTGGAGNKRGQEEPCKPKFPPMLGKPASSLFYAHALESPTSTSPADNNSSLSVAWGIPTLGKSICGSGIFFEPFRASLRHQAVAHADEWPFLLIACLPNMKKIRSSRSLQHIAKTVCSHYPHAPVPAMEAHNLGPIPSGLLHERRETRASRLLTLHKYKCRIPEECHDWHTRL